MSLATVLIVQSGLLTNQELAYQIGMFLLLVIIILLVFKQVVDAKKVLQLKEELKIYDQTLKRQGVQLVKHKEQIQSVTRNIDTLIKDELSGLKKSENQLLAALKTANLGFWEWDTTTDEMMFNHNFYSMLGYSPGMIKPNTATFVDHIHPDDRFNVAEKMQSSIRSLQNFEINFRMRNADNRFRWMLCRGKIAAVNSRNEAVRVLGILLDIHEMHQKESKILDQSIRLNKSLKQIEMAHAELKMKSERIREYSFMMSHNVRRPLANILGLLNLSKEEAFELDLQLILKSAKEMDEMIQDMHRVLGSHIDQIGDEIPIVKPFNTKTTKKG